MKNTLYIQLKIIDLKKEEIKETPSENGRCYIGGMIKK